MNGIHNMMSIHGIAVPYRAVDQRCNLFWLRRMLRACGWLHMRHPEE